MICAVPGPRHDAHRISSAPSACCRRPTSGDPATSRAARLYKISSTSIPTAEAHTYLGWTYSNMGRFDDAIEQCKTAILVDPEFGNPYNDIGSYLIQKGELDKAIPWLQMAKKAPRYEPALSLPPYRAYMKMGLLDKRARAAQARSSSRPSRWSGTRRETGGTVN
jgi:Tfp pilus assembly protein PilF